MYIQDDGWVMVFIATFNNFFSYIVTVFKTKIYDELLLLILFVFINVYW